MYIYIYIYIERERYYEKGYITKGYLKEIKRELTYERRVLRFSARPLRKFCRESRRLLCFLVKWPNSLFLFIFGWSACLVPMDLVGNASTVKWPKSLRSIAEICGDDKFMQKLHVLNRKQQKKKVI